MEMIILAAIAAFIVYRLYVTLGEKTGFDGDNQSQNNVVDFNRKATIEPRESTVTAEDIEDIPAEFASSVKDIQKYDKSFRFSDFVENATYAFEVIIEAYANGDKATLKDLTSRDVYKAFDEALKSLAAAGQSFENTLIRVEDVSVKDIELDRSVARITIQFVTEQVPLIKDKDGEIVDGNPNQIDQVVDYWTFERNLRHSNPQWTLVSTGS